MNTARLSVALALALASAPGAVLPGASAQPARPAPARPAPPAAATAPAVPATPAPATPQQTTAVFMDWVLRCTQLDPATKICEVVQGVQRDDKPVAQIALGHPGKAAPLQLTVLVPSSVTFGTAPVLLPGKEGEATAFAELTWRRCLPAGCLADVALTDDAQRRLRAWSDAGRIAFQDGTGRTAVMPFSPRGLPQALDALAKEEAP